MHLGRARLTKPVPPDVLAAVFSTLLAACTLLALGVVAVLRPHGMAVNPVVVARTRPVVVFMGDSYVSGAGAIDPDNRFGLLVANAMGWTEVNLGRGGTGYVGSVRGDPSTVACGLDYCPSYLEMIPEAVAVHPDIVAVTGGRNDLSRVTAPDWAARVAAFYVELRRAMPHAQVIAMSPIWDDRPIPAGLLTMRSVVRQAVMTVGGVYVDLGDPLLGRSDLVSPQNRVLPNDAGHVAIASAFVVAYRATQATQQPKATPSRTTPR